MCTAEARAEGPWNIAVGGGPAVHLRRYEYSAANDWAVGASARLDAGYRFARRLAVGPHLGIDYMREPAASALDRDRYYVPFELGVGAQVVIADRAMIAPWAGIGDIGDARPLAGGVDFAYDISVCGHDRVSAVAMLMVAHQPHISGTHISSGAGIAYRFW
jgi:hypothetical protein